MLYIFNNHNSVQIAWGSTVPSQRSEHRVKRQSNGGLFAFIRTFSAG